MLCPDCFGKTKFDRPPCETCGGVGIISCCDGACGEEDKKLRIGIADSDVNYLDADAVRKHRAKLEKE